MAQRELTNRHPLRAITGKLNKRFINDISKRVYRSLNRIDSAKSLFVVGNQRSGTTMLLRQLDKHLGVDIFGETSDAMSQFKLKDFGYVGELVRRSNAKVVIFKPLEDSHRIVEFVDHFNPAFGIWAFRHYHDVVNSSLKKSWGEQYQRYVEKIHAESHFDYSEPLNLTPENIDFIKSVYRPDISAETCTALIWYLRNSIYFDHELAKNPKVLAVSYEKMVTQPENEMTRILNFLQLEKRSAVFKGIHKRSIHKSSRPELDDEVEEACSKMYRQFMETLS